jgi:hypothetical protein
LGLPELQPNAMVPLTTRAAARRDNGMRKCRIEGNNVKRNKNARAAANFLQDKTHRSAIPSQNAISSHVPVPRFPVSGFPVSPVSRATRPARGILTEEAGSRPC